MANGITAGINPAPIDSATPETILDEPKDEIIGPSSTTGLPDHERIIDRKEVRLQPSPIILTGTTDAETPTAIEPLPFQEELPAAIQQELPTLKFAGHTYSSVPEERLIIINNGIKREGDQIEQGLNLDEITWDGVILNFRGLRFQVITTGS